MMRRARSHAVARGLENKRQLQQNSGHNFRVACLRDDPGQPTSKRKQSETLITLPSSLSGGASSPLHMLAAESPKLQTLLGHRKIFANTQNYLAQAYMECFRQGPTDGAGV